MLANRVAIGSAILGMAQVVVRLLDLPIRQQIANSRRSFISLALMAVVLLRIQAAVPGFTSHPALQLALLVPLGAAVYVFSHIIQWRITGSPAGAEQFMADGLSKLLARGRWPRGAINIKAHSK